MAERQWTEQQLRAIEADGTLTVLSAAAGSGKTTVLVEKALRMLLDEENKTPADRLLIVTFSNASAKEFKNRIEKGINKAIKQNPDNSYIKAQKVALQKADISTIHSFCIKLARENFEALDIAPDFVICDEAQSFDIHEQAIDAAMEYGYQNKDFCQYVSLFGKSSQDKQIREFLKDMFYYFSALPFPQKRAQQLADMAEEENFEDTETYRYLWRELGRQIDYAKYLVHRQKVLCVWGGVEAYMAGVLANSGRIDAIQQAYDDNDAQKIKEIASQKLLPLGRVKKGESSEQSEAVKSVNKILGDLLDEISSDVDYLDSTLYAQQQQQTQRYIKAITDVFVFYSQKLMEIKKAEKAFEFSDFEHFAVQLLIDEKSDRTALAKSLQDKYVKIMEDEFQDTSFVQDMVFKTIAKEKEQNLFVVGDVKQSIYGFRKASPEILLEKRSRYKKDASLGTTIVLPNNFRSEVNVIRGINYLFEQIMTQSLGGVDYREGEQLLPAPNKTDSGMPGTKILIANDNCSEAAMVADKIAQLIESGFEIDENGTKRKVKADDFCILLRNKKRFDEFSEALKAKGIQSFVKDEKPLLEKPEVQSIVSLLKVINNPLQEVYLTAGMFGDIFGFTLDDILELKLKNKKENLYRLLAQSENEKAKDFLALLKEFSFAAKVYSPDKLIDFIINATGYYQNLAFTENGSSKRENVRRFISFAREYTTGYRNYLGDFLRYIDLVITTGKSGSESFRQPAGTVAIMTMHTSKGLEFPICFVSGLGTPFNKMDRAKRLMIDPQIGMATYANESFGHNRSTAGIQAIKKKILNANADDEMRLLYVALTRAKNALFLTAQYSNMFTANTFRKVWEKTNRDISEYALRKANTPMEWILTGYREHPQIYGSYSNTGDMQAEHSVTFENMGIAKEDISIRDDYDFGTMLTFEFVDVNEVETETVQSEAIQHISVDFDVQKAKENFDYVYHNAAKTKLPIKVSVGEIAKAAPKISLKKPAFTKQQQFSAAQKGTQMHLFAQHSDILLARTDLQREVDRLCSEGIVERGLINIKQIERFVNSPVATIILNGEKVYKEKEFLMPYNAAAALGQDEYADETVMVQGVIDCLVISGDKGYIIDYKTDRVNSMDQLYKKYSKQLEMYRTAGGYLYEIKDIRCIIYSFYLDEYMEF